MPVPTSGKDARRARGAMEVSQIMSRTSSISAPLPAFAILLACFAANSQEIAWEGEIEVINAETIKGVPDGPVLPISGIVLPPIDLRCPPGEGQPACMEVGEEALRELTDGRSVMCEQEPFDLRCSVDGVDLAEHLVSRGLALADRERLYPAEDAARAASLGLWAASGWWDRPFEHQELPGRDAAESCDAASTAAWFREDYGGMMAIEAAEWFIEETRLRWEMATAMQGYDPEDPHDPETVAALDGARRFCDGFESATADEADDAGSGQAIALLENEAAAIAEKARETCWLAAARAAGSGAARDLIELRQIVSYTTKTSSLNAEQLWDAYDHEDEEAALRALQEGIGVFRRAAELCGNYLPG